MKLFLSTLFVLLFASVVFSGPKEEKLREQCLKPTVCLYSVKEHSVGTAFIVRSEKIGNKYHNVLVTANHCAIYDKYLVRVPSYNSRGLLLGYKEYPTYVHSGDEEKDLAIVLFESEEKMPTVQLDIDCDLEFGMKVFHIGFGLGDEARLDDGKITNLGTTTPPSLKDFIRTNVYTIFGDSGGPLFNEKNKVIGVAHGIRLAKGLIMPQHSYYAPISWLKTWDIETNNSITFVYNRKAKLPVMAYTVLRLQQYEVGVKKNAEFHVPPIEPAK